MSSQNSNNSAKEGPLLTHVIINQVRVGRLMGYHCQDCGLTAIEVQAYCKKCGSPKLRETELASQGRVVSFTIQAVSPEEFKTDAPYAWAIIELNGGVRVSGWIGSINSQHDLSIGERVRLLQSKNADIVFEKVLEGM